MKPAASLQLLSALSAERASLQAFISLLECEQGILIENLTDQLLKISEQKSSDALTLNALGETRRSLMRHYLPQLDVASIHAWLKTHSTQALAVWEEIRVLAERAQRVNQENGSMILKKLRSNQQLLAVLSNAVNKANLYGPDGQTNFQQGSGRSLGSV